MNSQKHTIAIAEAVIYRIIELLVKFLNLGGIIKDQIKELHAQIQSLDEHNPEFAEIIQDHRETMKLYWRLLIIFLSVWVDSLLSFQAMTILIDNYNMPDILKYFVPVFLIAVEIGISYFQIILQRNGEQGPWLVRNAQYFVILILAGLTVLSIIFSIQAYNSETDRMSFVSFVLGTLLWQLALFVASLMLHLWLIRNAEDIAETFAHLRYKIQRSRMAYRIHKLEKVNQKECKQPFINETYKLVQKIEAFKKQYPASDTDFTKVMPLDLIKSINMVMGRAVFLAENVDNT